MKPTNLELLIRKALKILSKGGVIIYPTESSYAIGVDATNYKAIEYLYEIKKRSKNKPIGVIVGNLKIARKYGIVSDIEEKFLSLIYPRNINIIVQKKNKKIPDILNKEFMFRIPSNLIALELATRYKKPITATSANISGKPNIYDPEELEIFKDKVDLIINVGKLNYNKVSSIVRLYRGKLEVLREGSITREELEKYYEMAKKISYSDSI